LNLSLITHEAMWSNVQERKFEIVSMAWNLILFPNPRSENHSTMADANGSNNISGIKSPEVDRLIEEYDKEFDLAKRTSLLRQIDGVIFNEHPYAMAWTISCERILYWNKFGMPPTVLHKYEDWRGVFSTWWVDPSKEQQLKAARKSGAAIAPIPPIEVRPWDGDDSKTARR